MKILRLLTLLLLCLHFKISHSQIIETIAGTYLGEGRSALDIGILPQGHAVDSVGNIYIAEPLKHMVRKLSKDGIYSMVAGNGISGYSGDGGPASLAQLTNPVYVALDKDGNIYIADSEDQRIRKVTSDGIITTIAGNGILGFSGDGGPAIAASLGSPSEIAVDSSGNLIISERYNYRIRKVVNGIIETIAGNGEADYSGDGGPATSASLSYISGLCVNNSGEIFVSGGGSHTIRKISKNGIIDRYAGSINFAGFSGDGQLATFAQLYYPSRMASDQEGNLFVCDVGNNRVRKIDKQGVISTVAGNGFSGTSLENVPAVSTSLRYLYCVAASKSGDLFIASEYSVQYVSKSGMINTVAGNGTPGYSGDSIQISMAQIYNPCGIITDSSGNVYFTERSGNRVRKIDSNGVLSTVAGNGKMDLTETVYRQV